MIPLLISFQLAGPGVDPRLSAPTELAVVMEPVASELALLGKKAGCSLEVARALQDRKVALFTEKEALGTTLDRLAEVLDAKWTETRNGWRLDPIPERASERAAYQRMRGELLIEAARNDLERKLATVRKSTLPEMQSRQAELQKEENAARTDKERQRISQELSSGEFLDIDDYAEAYVYGTLSNEERARFWNGEVFYATSAPLPGGRSLPEGASAWRDRVDLEEGQDEPQGDLRVFVRYHPVFQQLLFRTERDGTSSRSLPGVSPYVNDDRDANQPFQKRERAWNQEEPFASRREEKTLVLPPAGKGPWFAGFWSVSDVLARFHRRTGLPIVAMASRKPWPLANPDFDGPRWEGSPQETKRGTVGAALDTLSESGAQSLHESDGYLLCRPSDWSDRLAFEPPEELLRAFEAIPKPTLDDYAMVATRLTERQAYLMSRMEEMVSRHPFYAFSDGYSVLKLWGALTPKQRDYVRSGGSIPYASLSTSVRALFEQAVLNGIMEGATFGESVKRVFDGPWDGSLFNGMALWGQTKDVAATGHAFSGPSSARKNDGSFDNERRGGIRLTLGTAAGDGFSYTLDDPHRS
ncbi:hypothetical protein BH11ARM2_BH11ARM2_05360 [soil metagenome]